MERSPAGSEIVSVGVPFEDRPGIEEVVGRPGSPHIWLIFSHADDGAQINGTVDDGQAIGHSLFWIALLPGDVRRSWSTAGVDYPESIFRRQSFTQTR